MYNQWYHTVSLQEYALDTLQEEYCFQYHKINGKFPMPSIMSRDELIVEISLMRDGHTNTIADSISL